MQFFYNQSKSLPRRLAAIMLVISMFTVNFIQLSFAGNAKSPIRAWTFDTDSSSVYWSESHNRWEIKLSMEGYSLCADDGNDAMGLPQKIYILRPDTATPSNASATSTRQEESEWPVASDSNIDRTIAGPVQNDEEEEDEEDLPDYDLFDDRSKSAAKKHEKTFETVKSTEEAELATVSEAIATVPITWDLDPLFDYLTKYEEESEIDEGDDVIATASNADAASYEDGSPYWAAEFTIHASINSDTYRLSAAAEPVSVTVLLSAGNAFDEAVLNANSIETDSPDGLTLNLFDYWNTTKTEADHFGWSASDRQNELATGYWKKNIGKDHVLQFSGVTDTDKFGDWNSWIGSSQSAYQGLVQKKLVNGYPALNISEDKLSAATELSGRDRTESLSYLFDPEEEHDGKESFRNVKGLLSKNGAGYTYSCTKNFAEFIETPDDEDSDGYYRVYDTWGIKTNSGQKGQYFPFASIDKVFTNHNGTLTPNSIDARKFTHFFGLTGSMEFAKTNNGTVRFNTTSSNLHFNVSGTDDIWVFVDDVLIGDGGGNSDEKAINIDFATGDVIVKRVSNNTNETTHATTIKECFEAAGEKTDSFSGNTFADGTTHTLKFFQLERGSNASFLSFDFNTLDLEAVDREALLKNRLQTVSPENVRIDLHDYWNTRKTDKDYFKGSENNAEYQTRFWENGIGKNHILQFVNTANSLNRNGDTKNAFGDFNAWTGSSGMAYEGLVKSKLKDGYPVLNLSESQMSKATFLPNTEEKKNESLAYLFDPDFSQNGKDSYKNVNGIFHEEDGYYVYNGRDNYAEFVQTDDHSGRFNVYNIPAIIDNRGTIGQFFPFNRAADVVSVQADGSIAAGDTTCQTEGINHFFGLNMTIDFEQPKDGIIMNDDTSEKMQFHFIGDDDVWVFVDGILISDLGGIHDELYTTIDFSTGQIVRDRSYDATADSKKTSTIREQFEKAGADTSSFHGDTFADYTSHTLQFFYLERGSNASNLIMRFNLQHRPGNRIQKMDQDGNGLSGASFALYAADRDENGTFTIDDEQPDPLLDDIAVSNTGTVNLNYADGNVFDFSTYDHYILRETAAPNGYAGVPDIWITSANDMPADLSLQIGSAALYTENRFDTGVSIAHTMGLAGNLADLKMKNGSNAAFDPDSADKLVFMAVPYVRNLNADTPVWKPIYGSEQHGYWDAGEQEEESAAIEAMIGSIFEHYRNENAADWMFSYDTPSSQIKASVDPLPYAINRYGTEDADVSTDKDIAIRYYYLDLSALTSVKNLASPERADYLASLVKGRLTAGSSTDDIRNAVREVTASLIKNGIHAEQLSKDSIAKKTQAEIMAPNRERKLIIEKKNENGTYLANAEFSIYTTEADAKNGTNALYTGKTGTNGKLEFSPQPADTEIDSAGVNHVQAVFHLNDDGSARHYYLKETKAPTLYKENDSIVKITATANGLAVDRTDSESRIRVLDKPGILVAPLRKYAEGVDGTLNRIQWTQNGEKKVFSYDKDGQYVESSQAELGDTGSAVYAQTGTQWRNGALTGSDLTGKDLSNIFSHETIVEVTDSYKYAALTINKHINERYAPFGDATFLFKISGNGKVYHASITIPEGSIDGTTSIRMDYGHDYQIEEIGTSRYIPSETPVSVVKNASVNEDQTVTALLSTNKEAEVTFNNNITQYEKFSHATTVVNQVKSGQTKQDVSDPEEIKVPLSMENGTTPLMTDWKFNLGDAANAQDVSFDDSSWVTIDLPHDYSITQEYDANLESESAYLPGGTGWYRKILNIPESLAGKRVTLDFDGAYMNAVLYVNGTKLGSHPNGYTAFSFDITDALKPGETNVIAVRTENKVPSSRWYSGSGITRDVSLTITDAVHFKKNGIIVTTPDLEANQTTVTVQNDLTIANDGDEAKKLTVLTSITKKGEQTVLSSVNTSVTAAARTDTKISNPFAIKNPDLWTTDAPNLYTIHNEIYDGEELLQACDTDYGFRYMDFDPDQGFSLNGRHMKIRGVCMHSDLGALGTAMHGSALRRQVQILKRMGVNSIRTTHNPPSRMLIDICNEEGILLTEEIFDGWESVKNGNVNDYSAWITKTIGADNQIIGSTGSSMPWYEYDLAAAIGRDRNDPCVIMWSIGNELATNISTYTDFVSLNKKMLTYIENLDNTRPCTMGDDKSKIGNGTFITMQNDLANAGGTNGMNYASGSQYDSLHKAHPDWKIYGSEVASAINSRNYYKTSGHQNGTNRDKQLTSYDESRVSWGACASDALYTTIQRDYLFGSYSWTGFDYLGEPTPWQSQGSGAQGTWPSPKSSYFGIVDTAGFEKDSFYLYQSQWNDQIHTLHLLPTWDKNAVDIDLDGNVKVVVYSDAKSVELFFTDTNGNRTSLGRKEFATKQSSTGLYSYQIYEGADKSSTPHENLYLAWKVPYADGSIDAVAYDERGNMIANTDGRDHIETVGATTTLDASVWGGQETFYEDRDDLAFIEISLRDANGTVSTLDTSRVTVNVSGAGKLVAMDNGNSPDLESFFSGGRKAFAGKVLAIVKPYGEGEFTVTASAEGLAPAEITLTAAHAETSDAKKTIRSYVLSTKYTVAIGVTPDLPSQAEVRYTDGTTETLPVTWEEIPWQQVLEPGEFTVNGNIDDKIPMKVFVTVTSK